MDNQAPEWGIERVGRGKDFGKGKEALPSDFLVEASLKAFSHDFFLIWVDWTLLPG